MSTKNTSESVLCNEKTELNGIDVEITITN